VPWLAGAADGALAAGAALPALRWLLARADRSPAARPWRDWLLEDAALGADPCSRFPAGPCVQAAWRGAPAAGTWACAAPVHLVTALDHLRLAGPVPLPLEPGESAALVADLNRRLDGAGFDLQDVPGRGWLCGCPADFECRAPEPGPSVGGNLREFQPVGRDASRVRAWVNEAQMILHDHPVNQRRAARGLAPANSVWLWGFGAAAAVAGAADGLLLTDDDWLAGLWRLHGGRIGAPGGLGAALTGETGRLRLGIGLPHGDEVAARLQALERDVLAPVRDALGRGGLAAVAVHAGAVVLELDRRARWRFWRRRQRLGDPLGDRPGGAAP
jgi:hypothetical protein